MSKVVDERVVSMQFDNANFERNVSTSMSTLDKLKNALNFKGAEKGFNNISAAAKNVNMTSLGSSVEEVRMRFSALEVMGVTALANITNSAVNTGKTMIKALTLDPVMTGFQEYETQINAVQTILANTQSKGSTLEDVNKALDELNKYADQTIYNFTEMTRNIGTFTAAGVDLDKSVTSIKGIANLAAVSGSNATQASTAMYQLSQAIAAGKVQLMDWNSVVNAGMGGELFQNALKRTATQMGYNVDALIKKYGSFRESLTKGGWLTAEVLTETLTQLSGAYTEADLIAQGYSESQAKEITELAETAVNAATKVKTFTQLWDTMKEAAQSGWTQTWEILIGDFEEAKELLTGISDFFTGDNGVITKMSNARNNLLEGALNNNPFSKLAERIEKVTAVTDKMTEATQKYGKIADKVINGDFGNGAERIEKLTKAGYDWAYVQNLVNEKLGDSTRHATNFKESQDKLNESQATTIEQLMKMSDAQLKNLGFTKEEVEAFRELEEQSKKTGIPIKDLLKDMDQLNGRTLLINSFKNAGQGLIKVFTAMGTAWRNVFPAMTSAQLYDIIAALHKFSTGLIMSDETADKLTRTFQGLFSLLHLMTTILGGGAKLGFTILSKVLGTFGLTLLDVTAYIGDAITWLDKFILDNQLVNEAAELMAEGILAAGSAFKEFIEYLSGLPIVQKAISSFKNGLTELKDVGPYIIEGLSNGLEDGIRSIPQKMIEIGKAIIEAICGVLGIHSPSTVMFEIGQNVIQGLLNGLKAGASSVWNFMKSFGTGLIDILGDIDWGRVLAVGTLAGMLFVANKFANGFENLTAPLKGAGDLLSSASEVLEESSKGISKVLKATAFDKRMDGIKNLAIAIGILAASLYVLSKIDPGDLWNSVAVIAALAAILGALSLAIDKMSASSVDISKKGISISALKPSLVGIGIALLALAAVVKIVGGMNPEEAKAGFMGLAALMLSMATFLVAAGVVTKYSGGVTKLGASLLGMSAAIAILAVTAKMLSMMDPSTINKGIAGIMKFVGVFAAMALVTRIASGQKKRLGTTFLGMSTSILLMVGVVKLLSMMDKSTIDRGIEGIYQFVGVFAAMALITRLASSQKTKLGSTILGMSVSIALMAGITRLLGGMDPDVVKRGTNAIWSFVGVIGALTLIARLGKSSDVASSLVPMAVAIGILAAISVALSFVDTANLAKGIVAVGMLASLMTLMIWATRGANDVKGNLIVMTIAIAAMATAVAALSFIDTGKLLGASTALSMVMLAFAAMTKWSGTMDASIGSIVKMGVMVGLLAGILAVLSMLDVQNALPNAAAISLLMAAMTLALNEMKTVGAVSGSALATMGILTAIVAGLAVILGVMSALNVEASIPSAIALSTLLLSMSAAVMILNGAALVTPNALAAMGIMTAIVAGLAVILGIMSALNIEASIPSAVALSTLLLSMSAACVVASLIPAPAAISGALGLAAFIGIMAAVITAAGAIAQIPGVTWLVEEGGDLLQKIGEALGKLVGGLIGGVGAGVTASLPEMGSNLTAFMENLQGFLDGAKSIDASVVDSVTSLAKAILVITAASFVDGITRFLGLGDGISGFSEQTKSLGEGLKGFAESVSGLDASSIEKINLASKAIKALAEAADSIPNSGGWLGAIVGENDMSTFASQFKAVGKGITDFVSSVSGLDDSAVEKVKMAASILKELAQVAQEIPNTGGLLGSIVGNNDMDVFASQFPAVGRGLVGFANSLSGLDESAGEKIGSAAKMIKELAQVAQEIPNSGGLLGSIVGNNDMDTFGKQMPELGKGLTSFANSVSGLPDGVEEKVTVAINVIKQLADFVNSGALDGEEGIFAKIGNFFGGGGNETGVFGEQMKALGEAMSSFGSQVGTINVEAVTTATNAMKTILNSISSIGEVDSSVVSSVTSYIPQIGGALNQYATSVADIDSGAIGLSLSSMQRIVSLMGTMSGIDSAAVSSSISSIRQMIGAINMMTNVDASGVESFVSALEQLAKANVAGIVQAFKNGESQLTTVGSDLIGAVAKGMESNKSATDSSSTTVLTSMKNIFNAEKTNFNTIGVELITQVKNGIESQKGSVDAAVSSTVSSASSTLRGYYSSFYSAGAYVAQGFANGISANSFLAAAKASAMASAAATAARKTLNEHSPSKVFYEIGDFAGLGFVNALGEYAKKSYKAGSSMADYARKGLANAIGIARDLLENGINAQPTIRPVLDLSDIQSGAATLNQLLTKDDFTIGASSNIRAINAMMRQNGTAGTTDDVITAINKLRRELGNLESTQYNINGITYDDGSNVSRAVQELIRAARIERRS